MYVVNVGRYGSKMARVRSWSVPIWTGKLYQITQGKRGKYWKLVNYFGGTVSGNKPSKKFIDKIRNYGYTYMDVRNNDPVTEEQERDLQGAPELLSEVRK